MERGRTGALEVRARCEEAVVKGLSRRAADPEKGWLPWGVEWADRPELVDARPMMACGMAAPSARQTPEFLKFLAR